MRDMYSFFHKNVSSVERWLDLRRNAGRAAREIVDFGYDVVAYRQSFFAIHNA